MPDTKKISRNPSMDLWEENRGVRMTTTFVIGVLSLALSDAIPQLRGKVASYFWDFKQIPQNAKLKFTSNSI